MYSYIKKGIITLTKPLNNYKTSHLSVINLTIFNNTIKVIKIFFF